MNTALKVGKFLIDNKLKIAVVESCTGGLLSSALTDVPGSSAYIDFNLVTYSNEAKHNILGVPQTILDQFGAVSAECAQSMVNCIQQKTGADITVCTTGIAGPGGGTYTKPVGLCYVAVKYNNIITYKELRLPQEFNRVQMKREFVKNALKLILSRLQNKTPEVEGVLLADK